MEFRLANTMTNEEIDEEINLIEFILKDSSNVNSILNKEYSMLSLKTSGITFAGNGACFKTEPIGFLAKMMKRMYQERKEYKNQMLNSMKELEEIKKEIQNRNG